MQRGPFCGFMQDWLCKTTTRTATVSEALRREHERDLHEETKCRAAKLVRQRVREVRPEHFAHAIGNSTDCTISMLTSPTRPSRTRLQSSNIPLEPPSLPDPAHVSRSDRVRKPCFRHLQNFLPTSYAGPSTPHLHGRKAAGPTATAPTGSSLLGLVTFTDEPQGLLSPLIVDGTPPALTHTKPKQRGQPQSNVSDAERLHDSGGPGARDHPSNTSSV